MRDAVKIPLYLVAIVLLYLYGIGAYGFVLSKVWAWAAVTALSVPTLSITQGAALVVVAKVVAAAVRPLTDRRGARRNSEMGLDEFAQMAIRRLALPWLSLGLAWLACAVLF